MLISASVVISLHAVFKLTIGDKLVTTPEFYAVVALWTVARLTLSSIFPLGGDEAYHWQWSRHMDACFYDHPGMVAWLAWLLVPVKTHATCLIRLSPLLLGTGTVLATYHLGRVTGHAAEVAVRAALLILIVPLFFFGTLLMPMVAVTFFSVLAMLLLYRAIRRNRMRDWIIAGLALGGALNCNFTALLLIASGGLFIVSSPAHRRLLLSTGPYLSLIVALACCAPLIWWNSQHEWVTLGFNLMRRHRASAFRFENVAFYAGGLLLLLSPLLAIRMLHFGGSQFLRAIRADDAPTRFLAVMAFVPILAFLLTAAFLKPRPHYAAPAFVPLMLLCVREGVRRSCLQTPGPRGNAQRVWIRWPARVATATSMCIPMLVIAPALIPSARAHALLARFLPDRADKTIAEVYGWPALARYLDRTRIKFDHDSDTILIASSYAQASLTMTAADDVECAFSLDEGRIPYGQQIGIWDSLKNVPLKRNAFIIRAGHPENPEADLALWRSRFSRIEVVGPIQGEPLLDYFTIYRGFESTKTDLRKG